MKLRRYALGWSVLLLVAVGCYEDDPSCPAIPKPALEVEVRDSLTGALASAGATMVARDGAYVDSMVIAADLARITMAASRSGNYTLTITKAGYERFVRPGIIAEGDGCGPSAPVYVLARLRPAL